MTCGEKIGFFLGLLFILGFALVLNA